MTFCSVVMSACIFFFKKRPPTLLAAGEGRIVPGEWLTANTRPYSPAADVRPADQTFLTFPEWFLVFSPEEQAAYFKHHTATTFPYMSHTAQIWQSYRVVHQQVKDVFPPNKGYHFMIWVIGTSASIEYSVKAWYETIVGRLTDTHESVTEEDCFNATFTEDYVRFIKDRPWYEYDFKKQLGDLWTNTSLFGDDFMRKLERRYFLTSELLVKWGYGKLIGIGTESVYGAAVPTTAVVLANDSLVYLPRYARFAEAAHEITGKGFTFKEIAGNHSAILVTVVTSSTKAYIWNPARQLFIQPMASRPGWQRVALVVPGPELHLLLKGLAEQSLAPEHIFDY